MHASSQRSGLSETAQSKKISKQGKKNRTPWTLLTSQRVNDSKHNKEIESTMDTQVTSPYRTVLQIPPEDLVSLILLLLHLASQTSHISVLYQNPTKTYHIKTGVSRVSLSCSYHQSGDPKVSLISRRKFLPDRTHRHTSMFHDGSSVADTAQ